MSTFKTQWERDHLTRPVPHSRAEMEDAMRVCEQTTGFSVLAHGESVWKHLRELIDHLKGLYVLPEDSWRLPKWLDSHKDALLASLHPAGKLELYTTYHDCGKPYCRMIDKESGQQHFPNHAEVSRYVWACVGGNDAVGSLIANDMVLHTATAEEIRFKLENEWSSEDSVTLLLTALAEIHSNSKIMFGGIDSVNFKMKWKTLERRGNQICKFLFPVVSGGGNNESKGVCVCDPGTVPEPHSSEGD